MRLLRLLVFFLFVTGLGLLSCFAQTSTPQNAQTPATSQTPPAQQPAQPPSGIVRNPFAQQPAGPAAPQLAPDPGRLRILVAPRERLHKKRLEQLPDVPPDPGIYMRRSARFNGDVCGSIVSYNFSKGDNPHLESVTTCAPAMVQEGMRANEEQKPTPPRIIQTK